MLPMRPGRHGGMSSGDLECMITRNANFLTVRRAGSGDGQAGLYNGITGAYVGGIGGGWIPEFSKMSKPAYDCACSPGGVCRTGQHGQMLIRGWRNLIYELLCRNHIRPTRETASLIGEREMRDAVDYRLVAAPSFDPNQTEHYASL